MLKQIKWGALGIAASEIAAGILLVMFPALSSDVICYLVGVGACIFGIVNLVQYFLMKLEDSFFRNEFLIGVMSLLFGIVVMVKKDLIINLVPIVLGMIIVLSGFVKLQRAVVAFRIHYDKAWWYTGLGIIAIAAGLIVMVAISPRQTQEVLFKVIGGSLIYCGVSDLVTVLFLANKFHHYIQEFKAGHIVIQPKPKPEPAPAVQPEPQPVPEPQPEPVSQPAPEPVQTPSQPVSEGLVLPETEHKYEPEEIQLTLPDETPEETE